MRRLAGLDLDGWRDFGCRDWQGADDEKSTPEVIDGGFGAVVVELEDRWIGGPQAILSPIGRGDGWGEVGAAKRRRNLAAAWRGFLANGPDEHFSGDIRAAVDALVPRAEQVVLCMPDHAVMSERRQQELLAALTGLRRPPVTLLWRPVALLLDHLDGGSLSDATEGLRVACLIHGPEGLELQHLVLRQLTNQPGWLAPERAEVGEVHGVASGLGRLLRDAISAVKAANPWLADWQGDPSRLALDLLFSEADSVEPEVIRKRNGDWTMVHPPEVYAPALDTTGLPSIDADLVILASPLAKRHRTRLAKDVSRRIGRPLVLVQPGAMARGALRAARRIERGIAHYLDRLDQISLAVLRPEGPVFEDLIPPDATVPGNREYISAPITNMVWAAGMTQAHFYIRKGAREIRHWITPEVDAPARQERLEIRLRQMPAQGWARLTVTAPEWDVLRHAPIDLNWATLEIDGRNEVEILAALERPRPVVPQRVRYAAHVGLWDGSLARRSGVSAALQDLNTANEDSLRRFADTLRASYRLPTPDGLGAETVYSVDTDGDLPDALAEDEGHRLDQALRTIADRLLGAARGNGALHDNGLLLCLTWVFGRCPMEVQQEMVKALQTLREGEDRHHWLLRPRSASRVLIHGLGRVVKAPCLLLPLIRTLYQEIERPNFLAALSSLLTRPESTPELLSDEDVMEISRRCADQLRRFRSGYRFGVDFKYTLLAVGGLLRVRVRDPWALVADRSPIASALVDELAGIRAVIENRRRPISNQTAKLEIIGELLKLLSGEGGRPDLLAVMDDLSEN